MNKPSSPKSEFVNERSVNVNPTPSRATGKDVEGTNALRNAQYGNPSSKEYNQ